MAQFIGIAGDFLKQKALNRRLNAVMALFFAFCGIFFILGFVTAKTSIWWALAAAAIIFPAYRVIDRLFDKQIRIARSEEDGASGEREILPYLNKLPATYTVVCDLDFADSYGNIDHLVIGPTGIFAIDVKNWRGTVAADGKGELLYNGRLTDKPQVKYFTRRVMDLKDRLKVLTKLDPYIQCVFVFVSTRVDANWGATGAVHCIRIEQTADYITKTNGRKPIPSADLTRLVAGAKALKDTIAQKTSAPPRHAEEHVR